MKAIQVKYLAPTNHRGSRVKAFSEGVKPLTASFDYAVASDEDRAKYVATELCIRNGWLPNNGKAGEMLVGGQLPNGNYVFCFNEKYTVIKEALGLAEATIKRLNRHDSANGTLDVIREALK